MTEDGVGRFLLPLPVILGQSKYFTGSRIFRLLQRFCNIVDLESVPSLLTSRFKKIHGS